MENSGRVFGAGEPVVEPARIDLESPRGAAATGVAVEDALVRASSLRGQVRLLGGDAAERARGASGTLSGGDGRATTIPDARRAQTAADRVARATVENPAQALTGQIPSVAAALRVLA